MQVENLIEIIEDIVSGEDIKIDENSPLIGGNSSIDSMNLVQICLALEEKLSSVDFSSSAKQI